MSDELIVLGDDDKTTAFDGTRWECQAFLDSYFSMQRWITEGALESALERGEEENAKRYREILEELDRQVYRVSVEPLGFATGATIRSENLFRAMRMQTALEIFDAIIDGMDLSYDDKADS